MQTEYDYVCKASDINDRINRVKSIIESLEILAASVTGNADVEEYQLDDGQTRIRTSYRSSDDIQKSIMGWERYLHRLDAKLNGRVTRLRNFERVKGSTYFKK